GHRDHAPAQRRRVRQVSRPLAHRLRGHGARGPCRTADSNPTSSRCAVGEGREGPAGHTDRGHRHGQCDPYLGDEAPKARTRAMPATVTGNGAGMVLALDYRFFTDAVDSFTGDTLALHIQGPHKPVLLTDTPDGLRDRTEFRHLVMPKPLV